MKGLTVSEPWASLIASGEKWVENRVWSTDYRGWLAIHAGKGSRYLTAAALAGYPAGKIIAVARLVTVINLDRITPQIRAQYVTPTKTYQDILDHQYTEGPWCWILTDVRRVPDPISYLGQRGLWTVDAETFAELRRQFAAKTGTGS